MAELKYILPAIDQSKPFQTFRCVLNDITYEMTWQWNTRGEFWTCTIGAVGDIPIVKYKVTAFSNPMEVYGYNEDLPHGNLMILSTLNTRNRVAIDSIGADKIHWFVYTSDN